jgi:hypothetical protein
LSIQLKYLQLLRSDSFRSLEDSTVEALASRLRRSDGALCLPIRLSSIVEEFLIRPQPRMVFGRGDGHIEFDKLAGRFIITLHSARRQQQLDGAADEERRARFTYAHEVGHRFCYAQVDDQWFRALDLATSALPRGERLRTRVTIAQREEGFCNSVARRLLIPDEAVPTHCPIGRWFATGEGFFSMLSDAAAKFGVSRDCLLVRLSNWPWRKPTGAHLAMVVEPSHGPITQRGMSCLRATTSLLYAVPSTDELYPGIEASKMGEPLERALKEMIAGRCGRRGVVDSPIAIRGRGTMRLRGWFRVFLRTGGGGNRAYVWGELA